MFPAKLPIISQPSLVNNYSLTFDGTDDYVDCGDGASLDMSGDQPLTISAWVRPQNVSGSKVIVGFGSDMASGYARYRVALFLSGASPVLAWWAGIGDITTSATISAGEWTHLAVTYAGGNITTANSAIYINGVSQSLDTSGAESALIMDDMDWFRIGVDHGIAQDYRGEIDDIAVWNTDLAQSSINEVYNNRDVANLGAVESGNLKAWYRCEDGAGSTLTDSSSVGNDGSLENDTAWSTDVPN